jgi:hypothetical protein
MSLSESITSQVAMQMKDQAMNLINAGPRIRAAEFLEKWLRAAGIDAHAQGHLAGSYVSVHVMAIGDLSDVSDCLLRNDVYFDRHTVPGHGMTYFDCSVGSYSVRLCVAPDSYASCHTASQMIREAA